MNDLTLSERQLKAIYSIVQGLNLTGGRLGIAEAREPKRRKASDPSPGGCLSFGEMRDLELRLAERLFPHELPPHSVSVRIG